jgi:hypothetical protein
MNDFHLKPYALPHDGVIPGARGHKKQVIPAGTKVYCIVYGTKIYWAAYLDEQQALRCMNNLQASVNGQARRNIELNTMVAWNFKDAIPRRVVRLPS